MLEEKTLKTLIKEKGINLNEVFRQLKNEVIKVLIEEEMADNLGNQKHELSNDNSNSRNGNSRKTVNLQEVTGACKFFCVNGKKYAILQGEYYGKTKERKRCVGSVN